VASFASKESGRTRADEISDMWLWLLPGTSTEGARSTRLLGSAFAKDVWNTRVVTPAAAIRFTTARRDLPSPAGGPGYVASLTTQSLHRARGHEVRSGLHITRSRAGHPTAVGLPATVPEDPTYCTSPLAACLLLRFVSNFAIT
jgi:hypothetical protein